MPPYLVGAPPSIDAGWLTNPNPDTYASWEDFAKSLFWDFQLGEVFVLATARYATGWPARFHVVPGWAVQVDIENGLRSYTIGGEDVSGDILHLRYSGSVDDAHGHGPLEAGRSAVVAETLLRRYATGFAAAGGIPSSVLEHPDATVAADDDVVQIKQQHAAFEPCLRTVDVALWQMPAPVRRQRNGQLADDLSQPMPPFKAA